MNKNLCAMALLGLLAMVSALLARPIRVEVRQRVELVAGLSDPALAKRVAIAFHQAPDGAGRLVIGDGGQPFLLSASRKEGRLVSLRSGNPVLESKLLRGSNNKVMRRTRDGWLVALDYAPGTGNDRRGLFLLREDGSFHALKLSATYSGLGDLLPTPEGAWWFCDFEADNLWRFESEGKPEKALLSDPRPRGLTRLAWNPDDKQLYAANAKGSWMDDTAALYRISDGKAERLFDVAQVGGLAWNPGRLFPRGIYFTDPERGTVERIGVDGRPHALIEGLDHPADLMFEPATGTLWVTAANQVVWRFAPRANQRPGFMRDFHSGKSWVPGPPLADVRVRIGDLATVTDREGRGVIDGVGAGEQWVQVRHPGFHEWTERRVLDDLPLRLTLTPAIERRLKGRIVSADGEPVIGARVRLTPIDSDVLPRGPVVFASDHKGGFELVSIRDGDYRIEVDAPGHAPLRRRLRVPFAENSLTLRMKPDGSLPLLQLSEPDSADHPALIAPGQGAGGRIDPVGDVDWLRVRVSRPGLLRITMPAHAQMQQAIWLHAADGPAKVLRKAGSYAGSPVLLTHAVIPGEYLISIHEWGDNNASNIPYQLRVDLIPDDGVNDPRLVGAGIEPLRTLPLGHLAGATVWPLHDRDLYAIDLPAAGELRVEGRAPIQLHFALFDSAGKRLAERGAYADRPLRLAWQAKGPMRVMLQVDEWGDNDASPSPYIISSHWIPADPLDALARNDSLASATPVRDGVLLRGNILPLGDRDFYRFTVDHPGHLKLHGAAELDHQLQARLLNSKGKPIADVGAYARRPLTLDADLLPGTWFIDVGEWGNNDRFAQPYRLRLDLLRAEPEERPPLADDPVRRLRPGVARVFRIDQIGDRDRFALGVPEDGDWWLNIEAPLQIHARVTREGDDKPLLDQGWYAPTRAHVLLKRLKKGDRLRIALREWGDNDRSDTPGTILLAKQIVVPGGDRLRALPLERPGRVAFSREAVEGRLRALQVKVDADGDGRFDFTLPEEGVKRWSYPGPGLYQARVRQIFANQVAAGMTDGHRARNGSRWNAPGNTFWYDRARRFVIDLGKPVEVRGLRAQVDHNDDYLIESSLDGKRFTPMLKIPASAGKGGWGIDSFSTHDGDEGFDAGLEFTPARARFLRVSASAGDGAYAVAELTPLDAEGKPIAARPYTRKWPLEQRIWVDARGAEDTLGPVLALDGIPDSGLLERAVSVTAHARPSRGARLRAVRFLLDGKPLARLVSPPFRVSLPWDRLDAGSHQLVVEMEDSRGRRKRLSQAFRLADWFGLTPLDGAELSGENVRISWIGNAFGAARVRYRRLGQKSWKRVVGENGRRRSVLLRGLQPGEVYQFQVASGNGWTPTRRFKLLKGLAFGQAEYGATIQRDYDQRLAISVRNNADKPLKVRLECGQPADPRLLVGFVGAGSQDDEVSLAPGEERRFWLGISAQDVVSARHAFPIRIRAAGGLSDEARVNLNVRLPRVRLSWEDLGPAENGLGRRLRLHNHGDRLTDLKVRAEGSGIMLSPTINHGLLAAGGRLDLIATPVLAPGTRQVKARLVAEAVGKRITHSLRLGAEAGERVQPLLLAPGLDPERDPFDYQRELENQYLAADLDPDAVIWNTDAKGVDLDGDGRVDRWEQYDELDDVRWVGDDTDGDGRVDFVHADKGDDGLFEFSAFRDGKSWRRTNLVEGWLEMGFSLPWRRSLYRRHDVDIVFNGEVIGRLRDTIPNGNYRFVLPPRLVRFGKDGKPAGNRVGIQSKHLRGGHYVVNSDFRLGFRLTNARLWSSGADLGDARARLSRSAGVVLDRPDYSVSSSHFALVASGELTAGQHYPLRARLRNLGAAGAGPVEVALFDRRGRHEPVEVARKSVVVPTEGETLVELAWTASPGRHELSLVIDPDHRANDLERANDRAVLDVKVPGDPEPPVVRITAPRADSVLKSPHVPLAVDAHDDIELARVEARIDGGLWHELRNPRGDHFDAALLLQPGAHQLEVRASDAAGNLARVRRKLKIEAPVGKTHIVFPKAGSAIPVRYVDVVMRVPPGTRHALARVDGMPWHAARISYRSARARLPLRFGAQRIEVVTIDDRGIASRNAVEVRCTRQPRPGDKPPRGARPVSGRVHIAALGWIDIDDGLNTFASPDKEGER